MADTLVEGTADRASVAADAPAGRRQRWLLLRRSDFGRIWLGHGLSALGSHLSVLALPLLVLDQTGSATLAGLVGTIRMLAYTATNLPGGALADRLPRRAILVATDAVRAMLVLAIGVSLLSGRMFPLAVLLVLGAADTAASAIADPAGNSAIRHLVPADELPPALALGMGRNMAIGLVGPLLGGVLYQVAPAAPFVVDAVSYVLSMALILSVRRRLGGGERRTATLGHDIMAGLRTVFTSRFIMLFMSWAALVNFATAGLSFGLVLVIGPANGAALGTAMTIVALSGLAGTALAAKLSNVDGNTLVRTVTVATVLLAAVISWRPQPVVVTACVAGICLLGPVVAVPLNARLFAVVPDEMMGRVQSTVFLIGGSLYPFASVTSGWLVDRLSYTAAFSVFTAMLAAVLVLFLHPALRLPART